VSAQALLAIFSRFSRDDVVHAIPALAFDLTMAAPDVQMPPVVGEIVRAWMERRGIKADASGDAVVAALEATYRERPIQFELKAALNELLRELSRGNAGASFKSFLGEESAARVPLGNAPPPAPGGAKANPLARFALRAPNDDNPKKR
jgi:hypothetical protein